MGFAGRTLNKLLRPLGYEIALLPPPTTNTSHDQSTTNVFPIPIQEIIEQAHQNFCNEFDISPDCTLTRDEIRETISNYFWHYPFKFNPDLFVESDKKDFQGLSGRHLQRYNHFFPSILSLAGGNLKGKTVLDCGCNCGFWSIQSLRNGANKVLGFDGSKRNIDQANFLKKLIGLDEIEYRMFDIMDMEPAVIGQHNITFFFGVLYHLNMPIEALSRLKTVTLDFAVIDTTLDPSGQSILSVQTDIVHNQNFSNKLSMTPSSKAVIEMLKYVGFKKVWEIPNTSQDLPADYLSGRRKTFLAKV